MNAPDTSAESDRMRAWLLAVGSALFGALIWRMGERWMDARVPVACGAFALAVLAGALASKRSRPIVGAVRVVGVTVVMLVAAGWRSDFWIAWAAVALIVTGLDAARSRAEDRTLAPSAIGAAACVTWNAWRYGVPPLRVFVFVVATGLLAASVRGRLTR